MDLGCADGIREGGSSVRNRATLAKGFLVMLMTTMASTCVVVEEGPEDPGDNMDAMEDQEEEVLDESER